MRKCPAPSTFADSIYSVLIPVIYCLIKKVIGIENASISIRLSCVSYKPNQFIKINLGTRVDSVGIKKNPNNTIKSPFFSGYSNLAKEYAAIEEIINVSNVVITAIFIEFQ